MKKILIVALAFTAMQVTAQVQKKEHKMMSFSAEEMATLQTKKMTLYLDLNKSQQAKIYDINLENATKRKAMMETRKAKKESGNSEKPTKEERFKMMNAKLDYQIAMKAKMKDILNDEQFAKWEKAQVRKMHKTKKRKKEHNKKQE